MTTEELAAAIGHAWIEEDTWQFLSDLTAGGSRMAGSRGEKRAASLVATEFREAGLADVRTDPFELTGWERGTSELRLVEPQSRPFEAVALPYSPAGIVRGELVDLGHGTPSEIDAVRAELDGRIAMASTTTPEGERFVHRMEKYGCAVEAGVEGFVFVNHVDGQLPPTGSLTFGERAPVPAVGISRETGARLAEHSLGQVSSGSDHSARPRGPGAEPGVVELTVDADTTPAHSRNVLGHVGPDTEQKLLALAHFDAHDIAEGALDNGCGIATLVVAARMLTKVADGLDVGIQFAAVGAEEVGLLGSERLANRTDHDRIKGVLNVDGAGRYRDLVAMTHTSEATAGVAHRIAERTGHPIRVRDRPHPFSDQWPFVRAGIPALQLHSDTPERGRGWGHTEADTLDKVDGRNLREHGILTALLLDELAADGTTLSRLDTGELQVAFADAELEEGMRAAGLWPPQWK